MNLKTKLPPKGLIYPAWLRSHVYLCLPSKHIVEQQFKNHSTHTIISFLVKCQKNWRIMSFLLNTYAFHFILQIIKFLLFHCYHFSTFASRNPNTIHSTYDFFWCFEITVYCGTLMPTVDVIQTQQYWFFERSNTYKLNEIKEEYFRSL